MATEIDSSNGNLSTSSNSTQSTAWNYYNWCSDYHTSGLIFSTIFVICFLFGFPISLWVLHELLQRQRQRSTSDIFMLSLALTDLSLTAQIPLGVCNFMLWQIKDLQFIVDIILYFSVKGRPLFMACICWDCYIAVIYPILYKTSKKLVVIKKAITIIIFFIVAVCGFVEEQISLLSTSPFAAIPLIMALPVITFCDMSILQALRKPDPTGKIILHPQKKQALHTIFNSFIMTFVVYLPPLLIFAFGNMMPLGKSEIFCCLDCSGLCFATAGCIIMPILYLASVGKLTTFKNWLKK